MEPEMFAVEIREGSVASRKTIGSDRLPCPAVHRNATNPAMLIRHGGKEKIDELPVG